MCEGWQVLTETHFTFIYTCVCECVCLCTCAHVWWPPSSLDHLPWQKTSVSPAISQSDSWELDSGTMWKEGRGGGVREGKDRQGLIWKTVERNVGGVQEADILKGAWLTLDCPLPSLSPPLWGPGALPLRGHDWNPALMFHLASLHLQGSKVGVAGQMGAGGGGRDKASDKVGLQRLLALWLHHHTAVLHAPTNPLCLPDTSPWNESQALSQQLKRFSFLQPFPPQLVRHSPALTVFVTAGKEVGVLFYLFI